MRVTQGMISSDVLRQINNSNERLSTYQQQLASGKKITLPSQDPVVATLGIAYRSDVTHVTQYQRNVSNAYQWLNNSDSALGQMDSVMQRVRELTVQASNGTNTPNDLKQINSEVEQLKQQLVDVGNTQVAGNYIFNGQRTSTPPLSLQTNPDGTTAVNVNTAATNNQYKVQINDGVQMAINVDPTTVFTSKLFSDINTLQQRLTGKAPASDLTNSISDIDSHLSEINAARSDLGARTDRMDLVKNRLSQQSQDATTIMSNNEDADYTKTLVELNQEQSVHQAALSVGAKMIQPTLVDFLK